MTLPIEVVPNTEPPRFRWVQVVSTMTGDRMVVCEGSLPPSVEGAVATLVLIARQQAQDIDDLRRINQGYADRIAAQSEIMSRRAEAPAPQVVPTTKKGKGS